MTGDEMLALVDQIGYLAQSQIDLIDDAAATNAHTKFVLNEIIERCKAVKPSKTFRGADEIDDQLKKLVEGAIGFCEATREEEHSVWVSLVDRRDPPVTWRQHSGLLATIGQIDGRPVAVSLSPVDVAGHRVIFYHATSAVVDHDMVRAFIDLLAPDTARQGDRVNHSDATNMTNILPREWQTEGAKA